MKLGCTGCWEVRKLLLGREAALVILEARVEPEACEAVADMAALWGERGGLGLPSAPLSRDDGAPRAGYCNHPRTTHPHPTPLAVQPATLHCTLGRLLPRLDG